jgi:predicted kinase
VRIVGDQVRDELLGDSREPVHEARWLRAFTPIFEEQGYAEMMRRADRELAAGRIVVVDACFPRNAHRLRARSIARGRGAAFVLIECCALAPVVEARLAERTLQRLAEVDPRRPQRASRRELAPTSARPRTQHGPPLRPGGARDTVFAKRLAAPRAKRRSQARAHPCPTR